MKNQSSQSILATIFTLCLFSVSDTSVRAAPGSLEHIPLFVSAPVPPNIFFMLDDSGSMWWNLTTTGGGGWSSDYYDKTPNSADEWRTWCLGSNVLSYNSNTIYRPWAGNIPGTTTPFPDQVLTSAWSEPITMGGSLATSNTIDNNSTQTVDLSNAPIIQWVDADSDGVFDESECPTSDDYRVTRASALATNEEKTNFANWFTYYRNRDRTVTAAVGQVIATSSARMGLATFWGNNGVGTEIKDMAVDANKYALLADVANVWPGGSTPLRTRLDWVGQYFDKSTATPSGLNIGSPASPILPVSEGGECQQNFVMLMSDGERNGGPAGVDDQDLNVDNIFVYPGHRDTVGDRLADVAMKWYKTDLAPSYADKVTVQTGDNTQNLDENDAQHLVTFTVAFGVSSSLADPVDRTQAFSWPSGSLTDMQHAAYNGRGKFLSAGNPEQLVRSMQEVISEIESRKGSASAVSFNTSTLLNGTKLYFASFDSVDWKGDVTAFGINRVTGELDALSSWSAAEKLDAKTNVQMADRIIYTWGVDSAGSKDGVLFNWSLSDPKPDLTILNDFKINPDETTDLLPFNSSSDRLNFIRGDTSQEGTGLVRNRGSRLGDIIHSATRFVGSPISNWPNSGFFGIDGKRYSVYQSSTVRDEMVYVGANDGLLHGFRASDGEEMLAYLPSAPASELNNSGFHYLTEVDYQHRYYVDGSPLSADIYMPAIDTGNPWRTILVGALGGGGQGLYALDVTDPTQFLNTQPAANKTVLWEFTNQDDDHLGFSFSNPQVAMMNNGQWAVIIGNGYNATGTDHAELKILFIEKGLDGEWATAGDYITIDTGKGSSGNKNGLSAPTLIDLDGNGTTDRIYAGDLLGNLWVFDVSGNTTASWVVPYQDGSSNPEPLFIAADSSVAQPITMKPLVVKPDPAWIADDAGNNTPNLMVYFGTGQFIATGDAVNTNQQTFYGIWDAGAPAVKSKLVQQTPISNVPSDARVFTQNPVTLAPGVELGWYVNLPEAGERVVVDAFEHRGLIYFNTMTPSASPCDAGGTSWLMAVDMKTGGNPTFAAFDRDGNGNFNVDDQVSDGSTDYEVAGIRFGLGIASATAVITNEDGKSFAYISGTGGESDGGGGNGGLKKYDLPSAPKITGKRHSWIQLFN